MKFSAALSALLVILPLVVVQVSAAPSGALVRRDFVEAREPQFGGGGRGGNGGNKNAKNANKGAAAAPPAAKNNANKNANNANKGAAAAAAAPPAANNNANKNANNANKGAAAAAAAPPAAKNATAAAAPPAAGNGDAQTSLTLDPSVICPGFAQDGQSPPVTGQVASLTSTNNFINFCKGKTLTNGQQLTAGSCNPAPIGDIPSTDNMPSAKFAVPKLLQNFAVNAPFTVTMNIKGMITGNFVNAQASYFAAPQQLQGGVIKGHSHVVIEALKGAADTAPQNPKVFAFFKGLNGAAVNGALTADVDKGLPAGFYRVCSINTAANHQPAIVPVAQHGSLDDCTYFTVGDQANKDALAAVGADAAAAAGGNAAAGAAAGNAAAGAAAGNAAAGAAAGNATAGAAAGKDAGGKAAATGAAAAANTAAAKNNNNAAAKGNNAAKPAAKGNNAAKPAAQNNNAAKPAAKGNAAAQPAAKNNNKKGRRGFNLSRLD